MEGGKAQGVFWNVLKVGMRALPVLEKRLMTFPWVPDEFPDRKKQNFPGPASPNLCGEIASSTGGGMLMDGSLRGEGRGKREGRVVVSGPCSEKEKNTFPHPAAGNIR